MGCPRRDSLAGQLGKPAGEASADYPLRAAGTGSQTRHRQFTPTEATDCAALTLNPLSREETHEYIEARLTRAGMADQTLFSPDMIDAIYTRASGIPRIVNALCDN